MLANVLATRTSQVQKAFKDSSFIAAWAKEEVNGPYSEGISEGLPRWNISPESKNDPI
ncbi:S-layer homology domain-containing protein [Paenibacillus alvei]|uniref:S-layer homology domain-containing protein n=1 Tax=Paenibacillus alvei TaxID=44250 RepID=A0ABT4H3K9_PAEAL|nr:S-layer homology domain-containing protein [Paenibacillus alvei]MCY9763236.1 S-layer homology domain-containing protein [Paenibacillus alvei]MCY9769475.1 S-layer homology domain-containing protein [Paenibacillus alvei]